jgi:hypothetical protein
MGRNVTGGRGRNSALTPALSPGRGCPNGGRGRRGRRGGFVYGNAKTLAAEKEPEDAEFPILETVDVRMRLIVELVKRSGRDQMFASAFAARKEEWDIGDLFGEYAGGAIEPGNAMEWIVEARASGAGVVAG